MGEIQPDVIVTETKPGTDAAKERGIQELNDLIRRYKRERVDRMEEMFRK